MKWAAILGYGARGAVYLLVGGLALYSALSKVPVAPDQKHAIASLNSYPFGDFILLLMAAGLACFGILRVAQSLRNYDHLPQDMKGFATRIGYGLSAFVHFSLSLFTLRLAMGDGIRAAGAGAGNDGIAALLMAQPLGRWLVGLVGLGVIAAAVLQVVKAVKEKYRDYLDVDAAGMRYLSPITKIGLLSRAVVFAIVGYLFIKAAVAYDPARAGGVTEAFAFLKSQPWGNTLFIIVAVGMIAFAVSTICEGIYRKTPART